MISILCEFINPTKINLIYYCIIVNKAVKPVSGAIRRSFRAPVAQQGKEDVGDFFKNLLAGAGTSAKK